MWGFAKNLVKSAEGYISQASEAYEYNNQTQVSEPNYGFRVIHVDQNSPASESGIESLFDFIIGLNGHELDVESAPYQPPEVGTTPRQSMTASRSRSSSSAAAEFTPPAEAPIESFLEEVGNCKGRSISLEVWSAKGRVSRTIMLPVDESAVTEDNTSIGLGLTLQWTPLSVADHVWHVLNVSANSPAEQAGLISHADYIVGAENGLLEAGGESLLGRIVSRMVSQYQAEGQNGPPPELELYVYNHDYDTVRPVRIRPNNEWGGTGLLGCGVGYGLLHRLPAVAGKFDSYDNSTRQRSSSLYKNDNSLAPGGTLFESVDNSGVDEDTSQFITPANLNLAPPTSSEHNKRKTQQQQHHHHHHHHHVHPSTEPLSTDMQDYFAEEAQKSKELDGPRPPSNNKDKPAVPPPPKAGETKQHK